MTLLDVPPTFSSVIGLGAAQAMYPIRKGTKWLNLVGALVFLGGSAVAFLGGLVYTYSRWQDYGPAVIVGSITAPLIIAAVLFLLGLITAWSAYANWRKAVVIYQHGLAYSDRKGVQTWRWDEVASFYAAVTRHYTNGVYTGATHVYTIHKKNNTRLVLNDAITSVEEVAKNIREAIYPLLYQRYAQAYNSGQPITFGPVTLSKAGGIQIGKKAYPWEQVAKVTIQQGFVQVAKKGGGWFSGASVMASTIPNVDIMLSMIDQLVGISTK